MASAAGTIPRFLLPRNGPIWRRRAQVSDAWAAAAARREQRRRHASTTTTTTATGKAPSSPPPKPLVLEKPTRFNPPSHGARLPKRQTPRHYGGDLSAHEMRAQGVKEYPGTMAPAGTWGHWFWHNRNLHLFITLGTLGGLATFTFVENFRRNSPFADMMPALSDFLYHPLASTRIVVDIIRLSEAHNSAIVHEKRMRRVDDVAKRNEYRKAHGLEPAHGFWGTSAAKAEEVSLGEATSELEPTSQVPTSQVADGMGGGEAGTAGEEAPLRKKWLGIF